jgi:dihydroneopterin aldolase
MSAAPMNRIVLRRIAMQARIGVYAWEKAAPQPVVLDLELDLPHADACFSDDLEDTVDYAAVVERLRTLALTRPHRLVEAMAQSMCDVLLHEFGLPRVRLALMKLAPFPGAEVGIVVERERLPQAVDSYRFTETPQEHA